MKALFRTSPAALKNLAGTALLLMSLGCATHTQDGKGDVLAIGDISDYSVRFFDAKTGRPLERPLIAPGSGGLAGPMGILHDQRRREWLVANLVLEQPVPGEVLRYDAAGNPLGALVSGNDPNAPFNPRGMVLLGKGRERTLIVADIGDFDLSGKLLAYRVSGTRATFIANLDPNIDRPGTTPPFHARGVVLGPDGYLYVSIRNLPEPCGGSILRFDPRTLRYVDTVLSNPVDCNANVNDLQRPEGLVFSPDGDLYVTSFRRLPELCNCADNNKILIIPKKDLRSGKIRLPLDRIDLHRPDQPIVYAQALLFGPRGDLFVPMSNTGEVRRYDPDTKAYRSFVPVGGGLVEPWFLSFGRTDPATLKYGTWR
jgi:WD40 repeat protein